MNIVSLKWMPCPHFYIIVMSCLILTFYKFVYTYLKYIFFNRLFVLYLLTHGISKGAVKLRSVFHGPEQARKVIFHSRKCLISMRDLKFWQLVLRTLIKMALHFRFLLYAEKIHGCVKIFLERKLKCLPWVKTHEKP